jgi:hypothetical protein
MFGMEDELRERIEVLELENEELLRKLKNHSIVSANKRKEIIDYLYEFNVSGDIKIEEIADDIISIIEKE